MNPFTRIVTAASLTAFAIAAGVWLSQPPVTAAPPATESAPMGVLQVAPGAPIPGPVLGPAVPIDQLPRASSQALSQASSVLEMTIEAVVAPACPETACPETACPETACPETACPETACPETAWQCPNARWPRGVLRRW